MVPLLMGAAPIVLHSVLAEEREIIRAEGWYHVAQRYFANAFDADRQRRLEAERRVAEKNRSDRTEICAFCNNPILAGEPTVTVAGGQIHETPCAREFDAFVYAGEKPRLPDPAAVAGPGGENDPRWSLVTDATPVEFEGETTTWGELTVQDRKVVEMLPDGRLVGAYLL